MARWFVIAPPAFTAWIRFAIALAASAGVTVAAGVPSGLLANPFFVRMTPGAFVELRGVGGDLGATR